MCGDPVMFQQVLGIYTCRGLAPALHQLCLSPARMPTRGRYSTRGVDTGTAMDGHLQEPRENRPPPFTPRRFSPLTELRVSSFSPMF